MRPFCGSCPSPEAGTTEAVLLLHGIYMHGLVLLPLARRLRHAGFKPLIFNYPSLRRRPCVVADRLARQVLQLRIAVVHYVGHSLGGLVLRQLMAHYHGQLPPGRTVTLGTPHQGSAVARQLTARGLGWLLGASRHHELCGDLPPWPADRALGSLAGTAHYGLGSLLARLPEPHDGTVAVAETVCTGVTDTLCLPYTHTGLLLAGEVARQSAHFLRQGQFARTAEQASGEVLKSAAIR